MTHIFPIILQKMPRLQLTIIGSGLTKDLETVFQKHSSNVDFKGFVKDYRLILLNTNIFIAPIYSELA